MRAARVLVLAAWAAAPAHAEWQIILPGGQAPAASSPPASGRPALPAAPVVTGDCQAAVLPGDSLAILAQRHLGDGKRWREIQRLNGITDPDLIGAGWTLGMPCDGFRRRAAVENAGGGAADEASSTQLAELRRAGRPQPPARAEVEAGAKDMKDAAPPPSADASEAVVELAGNVVAEPDKQQPAVAAGGEQRQEAPETAAAQLTRSCSAVIQRGDSLAILAQRHLGDSKRWPELQALNGITDPDRISAGQTIQMPCTAGEAPTSMVMSTETTMPRGTALPASPAEPPAPGPEADQITREAIASAVRPDGKPPTGGGDEGRYDAWTAQAGERLDDVISRWAIEAGWTPIVTERWSWEFDTNVEVRGTFISAVRQLLQGFSSAGEAPGVAVYANQVLVLEYR